MMMVLPPRSSGGWPNKGDFKGSESFKGGWEKAMMMCVDGFNVWEGKGGGDIFLGVDVLG